MNKSYLLTLISFIFFNITFADGKIESYKSGLDRTMSFPDTKEYLTISTDLHTHSVFSDGHVWPNIWRHMAATGSGDFLLRSEAPKGAGRP